MMIFMTWSVMRAKARAWLEAAAEKPMDKQQQRFPDHLLNGYRNFMNGRFNEQQKRYKALAETGQKPKTMVVACCDSRAAPRHWRGSG